ncbi:glutamate--tRNA ligase family protein [Streptomyces sp. NPDC048291]|uniref:glutamate--tRNA ligase family protein n=1 Tax=Streptomyces sp. NPDC048291 TaxID=3365530 RepID=UPI00371F029D
MWRDADPAYVRARLNEGSPYNVRFRSPAAAGARRSFGDLIRGRFEDDDNRNDVVILESSDKAVRLPTYHFACVVDDHLLRVNVVVKR